MNTFVFASGLYCAKTWVDAKSDLIFSNALASHCPISNHSALLVDHAVVSPAFESSPHLSAYAP